MTTLRFHLQGAAVLAPGLSSLADLRAVSRGERAYAHAPLELPSPAQLPAAERRRASRAVRLVLACVEQLVQETGLAADEVHTVFATDEGTGEVCDQMLTALATTRQVSPLVFSNSVVNAPSGYFSIAWGNRRPSTVVSMGLESFASGLLCAVAEARARRKPVVLVAYDPPMSGPMEELLGVSEGTASAWVISVGEDAAQRPRLATLLASFSLTLQPASNAQASTLPAWMPIAWTRHSSARGLAALGLLDAAAGTSLRLPLGGQMLTLERAA